MNAFTSSFISAQTERCYGSAQATRTLRPGLVQLQGFTHYTLPFNYSTNSWICLLMPTAPDCLYGRIMKLLTFFLLLPESLKRTRKSGKQPGKLPACYEIVTLSLKKKMAAELYPASINTNLPNSNSTAVTPANKKTIVQVTQTATTPTATATQQNINNNNVETASWQSTHPTLRER